VGIGVGDGIAAGVDADAVDVVGMSGVMIGR